MPESGFSFSYLVSFDDSGYKKVAIIAAINMSTIQNDSGGIKNSTAINTTIRQIPTIISILLRLVSLSI